MYCYILDYSDCTICEINIEDKDEDLNSEELLEEYGLNIDTCAYMYSENKLVINTLEKEDNE